MRRGAAILGAAALLLGLACGRYGEPLRTPPSPPEAREREEPAGTPGAAPGATQAEEEDEEER